MNWTQQEIDKLLQPRLKVIADYPNSEYPVGEVLTASPSGKYWFYDIHNDVDYDLEPLNYPSIFRPLAWYEERDLNVLANQGLKVKWAGIYVPLADLIETIGENRIWLLGSTPITDEEYNKNK